ncbi:pyridoxamine 5'-phosphate oxidase family protein [Streptomyces sp. NPDC057543]|uniref:pyridoxamine 5'-phosphate oxidase family protein n=1 Tax=Streptomyces sp. NPDC057543 TaxID=3346163 RepID=UPI0036BF377E
MEREHRVHGLEPVGQPGRREGDRREHQRHEHHQLGHHAGGRRCALPAIRPVNHLLDHDQIVILTHQDSDLFAQAHDHGDRGVVVAYQADDIDPLTHLGWSVVATGYCRPITDPDALTRYQRLLRPWLGPVMNCAVRIRPHLVTGIRPTV